MALTSVPRTATVRRAPRVAVGDAELATARNHWKNPSWPAPGSRTGSQRAASCGARDSASRGDGIGSGGGCRRGVCWGSIHWGGMNSGWPARIRTVQCESWCRSRWWNLQSITQLQGVGVAFAHAAQVVGGGPGPGVYPRSVNTESASNPAISATESCSSCRVSDSHTASAAIRVSPSAREPVAARNPATPSVKNGPAKASGLLSCMTQSSWQPGLTIPGAV